MAAFACADDRQAVIYLLRRDSLAADGRLRRDVRPIAPMLRLPGLVPGVFSVSAFDTVLGRLVASSSISVDALGVLKLSTPPFVADLALVIRRSADVGT